VFDSTNKNDYDFLRGHVNRLPCASCFLLIRAWDFQLISSVVLKLFNLQPFSP